MPIFKGTSRAGVRRGIRSTGAAAGGIPPPITDPNIVAYWKMDEGTGDTISDSVGGLTMTRQSATWSAGKWGYALSNAGAASGAFTPNTASLNTADLSVYAWVKTTDSGAFRGIVDKGFNAGGYVVNVNSGKAAISVQNASLTFFTATSTSTVSTGDWVFIAGTFNSSTQELKIYVNGTNEATTTGSTKGTSTQDFYTHGDGGSTNYLNGVIDNVIIFNDVRSAAEILADYQATL